MRTDTAISRLVLTFFIPPLIWTSLIKFKWVYLLLLIPCMAFKLIFDSLSIMSIYVCMCHSAIEQVSQGEGEPFDELDSLETERALMLTDEDPV